MRLLLCLLLLAASAAAQPNVLLLIADDVGVDGVGAYGEHPVAARTPTLDSLAQSGVLFRNAWSTPVCSASRAALLTGEYGFRSGVGAGLPYATATYELSPAVTTLADLFLPTHETAVFGKWHLATQMGSGNGHPLLMGFGRHWGSNVNVGNSYFMWGKLIDTFFFITDKYATTDTVDDTIDFIQSTREPWFLWVAFNAAHHPFEPPPPELHSYDVLKPGEPFGRSGDPVGVGGGGSLVDLGPPANAPFRNGYSQGIVARAMVEALDREIGRLFASLPPDVAANTYVVFLGDNGPEDDVIMAPWPADHGKQTTYEVGVNVPLIIAGPGITQGAECEGLVHILDVFATVTELAGIPHSAGADSVSLVPYLSDPQRPSLRETVYTERFRPNGFGPFDLRHRAVRDARFKLRWEYPEGEDLPDVVELFDLVRDPLEQDNLLDEPLSPQAALAFDALTLAMDEYQLESSAAEGGSRP